MWWRKASEDRHDIAVLHDALKLRLRFGRDAESYCRAVIRQDSADPKRRAAVQELQYALELFPEQVPTYTDLHRP